MKFKNKLYTKSFYFWKSIPLGFVFVITLINGCINYEQEVSLYPDGSGTIDIHYWMKIPNYEKNQIVNDIGIFNPDSIKKELSSPQRTSDYMEYQTSPKYEFVEERNTNYQPPSYFSSARTTAGTDEQYYKELNEENDRYFSKNFLLIFAAFIVIVSIIVYMLMPNKGETGNISNQLTTPVDSIQEDKIQASLPIDTNKIIPEDESDFPRVASLPVADKNAKPVNPVKEKVIKETERPRTNESNPLYKKPVTDTKIGKTVYYDGSMYNVQVSSWRNKEKAEQEVVRLRGLGLNAFIFEAYLPQKGGTWYRVRIGNFKTKEEAEYFQSQNNF